MADLPAASDPFILHGRSNSGSAYKPALLLALAGLPFKTVLVRAGEQHAAEYLRLNPFGQVPVLEHGGLTVCQSPVMLRYIARVAGRFDVTDPVQSLEAVAWLAWEQDTFFPGISMTRHLMRTAPDAWPLIAFHRDKGERGLALLEQRLAGTAPFADGARDFILGAAASYVDVAVYAFARLAEEAGFDIEPLPAMRAWRGRIEAMPGWKRPQDLLPTA